MDLSWKLRGRLAGLAILTAAFVAANASPDLGAAVARTGGVTGPDTRSSSALDITLAQLQARAHLDRFFEAVLDERGIARNGAALKVALRDERTGAGSIVWITPFARRGDLLMGTLAAAPAPALRIRQGDLVRFHPEDVRDWSFTGPDGRMYGNFTTRLVLNAMAPDQAARIAAILSDSPAPADW